MTTYVCTIRIFTVYPSVQFIFFTVPVRVVRNSPCRMLSGKRSVLSTHDLWRCNIQVACVTWSVSPGVSLLFGLDARHYVRTRHSASTFFNVPLKTLVGSFLIVRYTQVSQSQYNTPESNRMSTSLSEKAKGKQRALDSVPAVPPPKDLTIRFTEGIPDLTIQLAEKDTVKDLKDTVRSIISFLAQHWQSSFHRFVTPAQT